MHANWPESWPGWGLHNACHSHPSAVFCSWTPPDQCRSHGRLFKRCPSSFTSSKSLRANAVCDLGHGEGRPTSPLLSSVSPVLINEPNDCVPLGEQWTLPFLPPPASVAVSIPPSPMCQSWRSGHSMAGAIWRLIEHLARIFLHLWTA